MTTKIEQLIPIEVYLKIKELSELVAAAKKVQYALSDQLYTVVEPYINLHDIELNNELLDAVPDGGIQFELRRRNRALKKLNNEGSTDETNHSHLS